MTTTNLPERKTAIVADDHPLIRESVRQVLEDLGAIEIVAEAENGLEAISLGKRRRPDLMVLDVAMPYARGIDVFVELRRFTPETRIAVLTGFSSATLLSEFVACGADGLFLKRGSRETLARGLRVVLSGGKFVAPEVIELLEHKPESLNLTARERQTLSFLAQGLVNSEIAERLNISPKTVEKHRTSLMAKLGVNSLSELLALALREGLLDPARQL